MTTVVVEFDGTTFVPQQPVDLPVGTRATVAIAPTALDASSAPRRPTAEELADKERFIAELNRTEPYFATVEEAIRHSRKRP